MNGEIELNFNDYNDDYDDDYYYNCQKEGRKGWKVGNIARVTKLGHKHGRGSHSRQHYCKNFKWKQSGRSWCEKEGRGESMKPFRSQIVNPHNNSAYGKDDQCQDNINDERINGYYLETSLWCHIEPYAKCEYHICYEPYAVGWKCERCVCRLQRSCLKGWWDTSVFKTCPYCSLRYY